jgi:hypothetical protein
VSWNAAYEVDEANNGYSLTNGNFRQRSQIEFATGMIMLALIGLQEFYFSINIFYLKTIGIHY